MIGNYMVSTMVNINSSIHMMYKHTISGIILKTLDIISFMLTLPSSNGVYKYCMSTLKTTLALSLVIDVFLMYIVI